MRGATFTDRAEAQPTGETQQVEVTRVVDGDTIEVSPSVEGTSDVRLIGVDTPETVAPGEPVEPCGPKASAFTTEQLEGQQVTLEFDEERTDQYNRALAYVFKGEELFNETLVREGYGEVLIIKPNDKYERELLAAQEEAQAEGIGIWADSGCSYSEGGTEPTSPEQRLRNKPLQCQAPQCRAPRRQRRLNPNLRADSTESVAVGAYSRLAVLRQVRCQ